MNTTFTTSKPFNPQKIQPRKVDFQFSTEIPKLWHNNSPIMTHFFNGINLFLPTFELFMVRVMKSQLSNIKDSQLKTQICGFISQEANHSQAHHQYNQILREQGYKFETWLKISDFILLEILEKRLGQVVSLATIAGFEHLTTLLAEIILKANMLEPAHSRMRQLWQWHAAEEIEHSSVAFIFLQQVNNSYLLRFIGGLLGAAIVVGFIAVGMLSLVVQERNFISWKTLMDLKKLLFTKYKLVPYGLKTFFQYFKLKFYPCNQDVYTLAEKVFN
ncbi:metal-dependent hydrolase [Plectonema cf. radiosum LEGE 06105]|uniref:Metal-dependent hydrolase n=1 Tax=Plectonema cf. radiosum LEGE 06105 TaxID=945769 RepID=A0A8J7F5G5_9CYAN|nr:metal-dependent hydrolase [Plectonema radiosum]MBE9214115.1 metal-dependent hydrolase [Plectonema cf. radiosum LEGE 06105]